MNKKAIFGAGWVFLKDSDGKSHRVAIISEASVERSQAQVELHGENEYAEDVANGKASVKGSLKFAHVDPRLIAAVSSGTLTSGSHQVVTETGTIPANPGPYTVTPAQSATFIEDLGIYIAGNPATVVASSPATGEYSINSTTGVATFAAADQGLAFEQSYRYSVTTGKTVSIVNGSMGEADEFELILYNKYRSNRIGLLFHAVSMSKWDLAFGNEAHATQGLDFTAYAKSTNGKVADLWVG